ncbi:MAG: DUF4175 family protein [Polyangiaceae bacterium]|nr:DUF4175 family protein [Polyangiaceae bacterium]
MAPSFPPPKPPPRLSRRRELARLREPFVSALTAPARRLSLAALLAAVVAGAWLARLGTPGPRAAAIAGVAVVLIVGVVVAARDRRRAASLERWLSAMVARADPDGAARALRALGLLERAKQDDGVGSRELAEAHATRSLARVSVDAVALFARRRSRALAWAALALFLPATAGFIASPSRVVEGLLVAAARRGQAPLTLTYLEDVRVTVRPPEYLRRKEYVASAAAGLEAPVGSALSVHGTPALRGRALVLTDLAGHEIAFADDGAGGVTARWALSGTVLLRVAARLGETLVLQDGAIAVTAVPDLPPRVRLDGAPSTAKLVEQPETRVAYEAEDDHGLRQVDLVLRAGGKEERRTLSRPEGDTRADRGGYTLRADDRFVRASYLPIEVTVEARDNDPITGPKWGKSDAITLVPPAIGELEAERARALFEARDTLVDLLAELSTAAPPPSTADVRAKLAAARAKIDEIMARSFGPVRFSPKTRAFVAGQLARLRAAEGPSSDTKQAIAAVERAAIALDRAATTIATKDAARLAKRVSRLATDVGDALLSAARDVDKARSLARADAGVAALGPSGAAIRQLWVLGNDLGEIIENGQRRIVRARSTGDLAHAELAARDLAARLARPHPSFRGGSGGGGGGGDGSGGEPQPGDESPADDEESFDQEQRALEELAREHGENQESVERALRDAAKEAGGDELLDEAKRRATELREIASRLGSADGDPDAPLEKGRQGLLDMAEALERGELQGARDAGRRAGRELGEAGKEPQDRGGDDAASLLDRARRQAAARGAADGRDKLAPHQRWVEELEAKVKKKLEERGQLKESAGREGQIADRVGELGRAPGARSDATARSLKEAEARMRDAEKALKSGDLQRGRDAQDQAQRLLEQARDSGSDDGDDGGQQPKGGEQKGAKSKRDGKEEGDGGEPSQHGDVPAKDAHKGPEELRRRVQEGMRRGVSPEVRDAVRRYTERLLK